MHEDPGPISFNPYHHHNPNSDKWAATNPGISCGNLPNRNQESMEIDAETPRLWKNSPSPSHPLLFPSNSRAEAIARGQWELMEMVKNMPESSYELSLKDMVEHHRSIETSGPESGPVGSSPGDVISPSLNQRAVVKVRRPDDQNRKIDRNLSFENKGLFLNMVSPFSIKSKKKNNIVKIPAKSEGLKGERDWWKKKFRGSSDSDSSKTSNNSGGGSSSSGGGSSGGSSDSGRWKRNGILCACWPFFHSRIKKSAN